MFDLLGNDASYFVVWVWLVLVYLFDLRFGYLEYRQRLTGLRTVKYLMLHLF